MKAIFNNNREVEFKTLSAGNTFIDKEFDDNTVFMVIEPSIEVDITPDRNLVDEDEFYGYAVDLMHGGVYGFSSDDMVLPVEASLVVNM